MSGSDWIRHPDSSNDYTVGLDNLVAPVGAGVHSLKFHGPLGSAFKRDFYYNRFVNNVSGSQELSCALRLASSATNVRVGLFAMWDVLDLDDVEKAYLCYVKSVSGSNLGVFVSEGPAEGGALLTGPGTLLSFNNWYQLLFQLKFDQVGNLELRVAVSNAQAVSLASPVYTLNFPEIVIPAAQARTTGKFGFFVDSRQENFDVYVDHISVDTVLTAL